MPGNKQIQIRRDTAANWTSVNPVLASGEFGLEADTGKIKFGDGSTHWTGLAYDLVAGSCSGSSGSCTGNAATATTSAACSGNAATATSAAALSVTGQTGLLTVTGLASTNRAKTVRDAADTLLELGGSYTPTGTWTSLTLVTPALGTPASGTLTNCTGLPVAGLAADPDYVGAPNAITTTANLVAGVWNVCTATSAAYTVTLPAPAADLVVRVRIDPSSTYLVTVHAHSAELIDGVTTRVMWAGEKAVLLSDGTSWFKISGLTIPMQCIMYLNANQSGVVTATDTLVAVNATEMDNTGLMGANLASSEITILRPGNYLVTGAATFSDLTGAAPRLHTAIYQNGSPVGPLAECAAQTGGFTSVVDSCVLPASASDKFQVYGYHNEGSNQTFRGAAYTASPSLIMVTEQPTW